MLRYLPNSQIFIVILVTIFFSSVHAQVGKIKKGEGHFDGYSYAKAIEKFEELEEKTPEINKKLAHSYWKLHDYEKAEEYFRLVVQQEVVDPIDYYHFAETLKSNGKYDEVDQWMNKYYELASDDSRAKMHTEQTGYIKVLQKDIGRFQITNLNVNSAQQDFGPAYYGDSKLVFASSREGVKPVERKWNWNGLPFLDLYVGEIDSSGQLSNVQEFHKGFNRKYHEGPAVFANNGQLVVFTRNNYESKAAEGIRKLQLISTTIKDDEWQDEQPFPYNSNEFSVGHAALSEDGNTMYFASDMSGGIGGTDIYKTTINDKGEWGKPENLGKPINTEGDEMFPYFSESENVLYFASNGLPGLGGLDVFQANLSKENDIPVNLGSPINSRYDDFSFIINASNNSGYFASNRNDGHGSDDLYYFTRHSVSKIGCQSTCAQEPCVILDLSGSEGFSEELFEYEWDMGDGNILKGATVDYCYKNPGTYLVNVSSINKFSGEVNRNIQSAELAIEGATHTAAVIDAPAKANLNKDVKFSATNSYSTEGSVQKYLWEFPDGTMDTVETVSRSFASTGRLQVTLTIGVGTGDDLCCEVSSVASLFIDESTNAEKLTLNENGVVDRSYFNPSDLFNCTITVVDAADGNVLANSLVRVIDDKGNLWEELKTDDQGKIITSINRNLSYELTGSLDKYADNMVAFKTSGLTEYQYSNVEIPLNKSGLSIYGMFVDKESDSLITNVSYQVVDVNGAVIMSKDSRDGNFSFSLPLEDYKSSNLLIKGDKEGYIGDGKEVVISVDKSKEINVGKIKLSKLELGSNLEDMIAINPIYFDVNKSNIRPDAAVELDKIVAVMKEHPTIVIELGSHTDSRGSDEYNMKLSDRRAKSSAQYIIDKGIEKERIYGVGYGETKLKNHCSNGVTCSKKEHQENRRTEFKIVKM